MRVLGRRCVGQSEGGAWSGRWLRELGAAGELYDHGQNGDGVDQPRRHQDKSTGFSFVESVLRDAGVGGKLGMHGIASKMGARIQRSVQF